MEDMKKNLLRASCKANIEFRDARAEGDLVQRILAEEIMLPAKNEQINLMTSYTLALRKIFQGHTIRRALDATDWQGQPISGLKPYISQQILLTPSEEESEALERTATAIVAEHDTARTAAMVAQAEGHVSVCFYTDVLITFYRTDTSRRDHVLKCPSWTDTPQHDGKPSGTHTLRLS